MPDNVRSALQGAIDAGVVPSSVVEALPEGLRPFLTTPEGLAVLFVVLGLLVVVLGLGLGRGGRGGGGKSGRGSSIVIAGPSNSGKTTLFYMLKDGSTHLGVVASMAENAATVSVKPPAGSGRAARSGVAIVDVPGHHTARHRLEALLNSAAAVVFVVDAVEVTPHRTEAADVLFEVLAHPAVQRRRTPVLIACNKADLELEAHSVEFVRKTLERQLDAMRRTRAAAIGKDAGARAALGPADRPFSFAALPNKVALAEASAKAGKLDDVLTFIATHA